jgi:ribosomal protein S12 methylthiotransferase accessory factor YcaO
MATSIEKFNILKIINNFKPKVTELAWTESFKVPFFDFEVEIVINELSGLGRGTSSKSKDKAIEIAITEAFERIVSKVTNQKNTNGISGHTNIETAKVNAAKELIERHVFLKNYYSDNFIGAQTDLMYKAYWESYSNFFKSFSTNNFLIGEALYQNKMLYVIMNVSRIKSNSNCDGYVIGLGCDFNIKSASNSAEIESMRAVAHTATVDVKSICIDSFLSIDRHSFEDHMLLSMNSNFSNSIESKFNFLDGNLEFCFEDLIVSEIKLPPTLKELGLYFAKASSNRSLDLFVGMPNADFKRKYKILYPSFYTEMNFNFPHILG